MGHNKRNTWNCERHLCFKVVSAGAGAGAAGAGVGAGAAGAAGAGMVIITIIRGVRGGRALTPFYVG